MRTRRGTRLLSVIVPLAAITISLWAGRAALEDLFAGPAVSAWVGLITLVLVEGLVGYLIALGLAAVLDLRAAAFFQIARELNRYTVLQGRRDEEFLRALRRLRPDAFVHSKKAGIPRLFTLFVDEDGVLLLGRGRRPKVIAAFHWLHVPEITTAYPDGGRRQGSGSTQQEVVFVIRQRGADVPLGFPLERAKVAWTERAFIEADPMKAAVTSLQGHRYVNAMRPADPEFTTEDRATGGRATKNRATGHRGVEEAQERIRLLSRDADLGGTDYERDAREYESRPRARLRLASASALRSRRIALARALVIMTLVCVAGPIVVPLLMT